MTSLYFNLFLLSINIVVLIITIKLGKKLGRDIPIDDSQWGLDAKIKEYVRNFMGQSDETVISVIGKQYANSMLKNEKSTHGFSFVTDNYFYFIGQNFYKSFGLFWQKNKQMKISIRNLIRVETGTKRSMRCMVLFITMLINLLHSIYSVIKGLDGLDPYYFEERDIYNLLLYLGFITGALCLIFLIYSILSLISEKRTYMTLVFDTVSVRFPISLYGKNDIQEYYGAVSKIKSIEAKKQSEATVQVTNSQIANPQTDKIQSLSELSKLLSQGVISQEEFESLKQEVMAK